MTAREAMDLRICTYHGEPLSMSIVGVDFCRQCRRDARQRDGELPADRRLVLRVLNTGPEYQERAS